MKARAAMTAVAAMALLLAGCQGDAAASPTEAPTSVLDTSTATAAPPLPGPTEAPPTPEATQAPTQVAASTATPGPRPAPPAPPTPMPVVAAASTPEPAPVAAPTQSLAQVVSSVSSAVVMISARQGFGSGFIIDKHGYILTAGHVVAGLSSVTVTLADGTEEPGLVIGRDEIRDLGMIKISGREDLPVARLGNVADIGVGVAVMALGHADFNEGVSITSGVVSDLVIQETDGFSYLQTDAGFYSGQSGGPVITRTGEVVGVVSLGQFTNFSAPAGWAIALDDFTLWMVERLKAGEQVLKPMEVAIGRTRDNPAPIGHTVRVHGIAADGTDSIHDITVIQVLRDGRAEEMLQAAFQWNPPPPAGIDYLLALVRIKYVQGPEGRTDWMHQMDFGMLSTQGVKYFSFLGVVPPEPYLSARGYPGSEFTGWTVWEISQADAEPMMVFGLDWSFRGKAFFALTEDEGPAPAATEVAEDIGGGEEGQGADDDGDGGGEDDGDPGGG